MRVKTLTCLTPTTLGFISNWFERESKWGVLDVVSPMAPGKGISIYQNWSERLF